MDKNYYKEYYVLERNHWWFKARLQILESLIQKFFAPPSSEKAKILNAGVATGATSFMLEKFGEVQSLEYDEDCCAFLEETVKMEVIQGSLTDLPFENNSFDIVCAFDVVEHIEDHELAISEIKRVLKPTGKVFLTVPAFMFLWSQHDVINHHFRRYTRSNFKGLVNNMKLNIVFSSYFNFLLFLPITLARILSKTWNKIKRVNPKDRSDFEKFKTGGITNQMFFNIFNAEKALVKRGIKMPFGVSILLVAEKS